MRYSSAKNSRMPIRKLIWYTFPLKTVGGGERLLLEGLRWFGNNNIDAYLFADGEGVAKEALFDSQYSPKILLCPATRSGLFGQFRNWLDKMAFLRQQNPDVVIANSQAEAFKIWAYNLLTRSRLRYVCFIHGSFFQFPDETDKYAMVFRHAFSQIREADPVYKELIPEHAPATSITKRLRRELMNYLRYRAVRRAGAVFVLTGKAKREIVLLYRHTNVQVVHGAFSREIFSYQPKENKKEKWAIGARSMIFSMCRLVDKKRVDLIVRAFAVFSKTHPNAILLIGGNGPEKENLQRLSSDLGIAQSVLFLGYVPDHELLDYYCSADIFVTADNADYDITTFVALALGKKVVASAQHEFEPHLAELNLLFHAEPTPQGFSSALALASEARASAQSREKLLDDYTWEHYFNSVKQSIENIS
jgi:glycosyltransferase involved in cell wall biosynthesis